MLTKRQSAWMTSIFSQSDSGKTCEPTRWQMVVFMQLLMLFLCFSRDTLAVVADPPEISIGTLPVGTRIPFSVVLRAAPGEVLNPNLRWVSSIEVLRWVGFADTGKDRTQEAQFDFEITAKFPGPFNHSVTLVTGLVSPEVVDVPVRGVITATAYYFYTADDPDAQNVLSLAQQLAATAGTSAITLVPVPLTDPQNMETYRRVVADHGLPLDFPPKTTLFLAFRAFSTSNGISSALRNAYTGSPFPESEHPTKFATGPEPAAPGAAPTPPPPSAPEPSAGKPKYVAQIYFRYTCTKCADALKTFGESTFARHGNNLSMIEFSTFDLDKPDVAAKIKAALGDRPYPEDPDAMFVATGELGSDLQLVPGTVALLDGLGSAIDKIVLEEKRPDVAQAVPPAVELPTIVPRPAPAPPIDVSQQPDQVAAEPVQAIAVDSSTLPVAAAPPYSPPPLGNTGTLVFVILTFIVGGAIVLMLILVEGRLRRIEEVLGMANRSHKDQSGSQDAT
ncbi:MAG: hypothetical protein HUU55_08785 [Myxococcales bacterium]|nr:hypothetical protein [Myxococcales bacterium]